MKPIDLTKQLSKYKTGWVALNEKQEIVAYGKTFSAVSNKVKGHKNLLLVPASRNYFGFITFVNG